MVRSIKLTPSSTRRPVALHPRAAAVLALLLSLANVAVAQSPPPLPWETPEPRLAQALPPADDGFRLQPEIPAGEGLEPAADGVAAPEGLAEEMPPFGTHDLDEAMAADCCKGCPSFWYAMGEALFISRDNSDLEAISFNITTPNLDYEPGARITIGRQNDCLNGVEFTYTGFLDWDERNVVTDPAQGLQSMFTAPAAAIADFNDALTHQTQYEADFESFELNRRQWGWDIFSTLFGVRYIKVNERFTFSSLPGPPDPTFGQYRIRTENHLFGIQGGGDILYPIGQRTTLGAKAKLGGYINTSEQGTLIVNDSATLLSNSADRVDVAVMIELGMYANYRVFNWMTLRAGYEAWWLWGVALAPEQMEFVLSPTTGTTIDREGTILFHGLTAGAEFQW